MLGCRGSGYWPDQHRLLGTASWPRPISSSGPPVCRSHCRVCEKTLLTRLWAGLGSENLGGGPRWLMGILRVMLVWCGGFIFTYQHLFYK